MENLYNTNFVLGEGQIPSKLMLIGEAPGADEDRMGKPFCGQAGRTLTRLLTSTGLKRKDIYITNSVKQRPPNNRKPTDYEVQAHRPYLVAEIDLVKPKAILLMGATALLSLLGYRKLTPYVKETLTHGSMAVIVTYHPAVLFYDKSRLKYIEEALQRFAAYK